MSDKPNVDPYGFEKETADGLRRIVTDMVKSDMQLRVDKKEYVAGVNEVLKENKKRTEAAVARLLQIEGASADKLHDRLAEAFLKAQTSQTLGTKKDLVLGGVPVPNTAGIPSKH